MKLEEKEKQLKTLELIMKHFKDIKAKYQSYKTRSKKNNLDFELTEVQFANICVMDCHFCGKSTKDKINGIDRLNNSLGYVIINVAPSCWPCNRGKSNMGRVEFYKYRKALSEHIN